MKNSVYNNKEGTQQINMAAKILLKAMVNMGMSPEIITEYLKEMESDK